MVDLFKSVFDDEMFAELYYVEENPAIVQTINVYKVDGHVHADEEKKEFTLVRLREEEPRFDLMHTFFVKLNFQWHPEQIKYFSGGLLARLFGRRDPKRLENLITNFDWIIATQEVIDEIKTLVDCHPADQTLMEEPTEFMPLYVLRGTTVYLIPKDIVAAHGYKGTIYAGHRRSITPVVHTSENQIFFHINEDPDVKKFVLR